MAVAAKATAVTARVAASMETASATTACQNKDTTYAKQSQVLAPGTLRERLARVRRQPQAAAEHRFNRQDALQIHRTQTGTGFRGAKGVKSQPFSDSILTSSGICAVHTLRTAIIRVQTSP